MGIKKEYFSGKNLGSKLEVESKKGVLTSSIINAGKSNEKIQFRFTGRIKKNTPTVIGTIELSAEKLGSIYPKYLTKVPNIIPGENLNLNSRVQLKLRETIKDPNFKSQTPSSIQYKNNTISYLFDIVYVAKEDTSSVKPIRYSIQSSKLAKNIKEAKITRISSFNCGDAKVNPQGEERTIKITGDPNAPYKIAVVKINETFNTSTNAKGFKDVLRNITNYESILSKKVANSTHDGISVIEGRLSSTGEYSFVQKFPRSYSNTRYSVKLYYPGVSVSRGWFPSSEYVKKLKGSFDYYPQSKIGGITSNPAFMWKLGPQLEGWEEWYCKTLTQELPRKIVIRATTSSVLYTINRQSIPAGRGSQKVDKIIWKKDTSRGDNTTFKVSYYMEVVNPSTNLSKAAHTLAFDNAGGTSTFTGDTNQNTNGGSIINIDKIVSTNGVTGCTANKCYLVKFVVNIVQWGDKDILITLPIDTLITILP